MEAQERDGKESRRAGLGRSQEPRNSKIALGLGMGVALIGLRRRNWPAAALALAGGALAYRARLVPTWQSAGTRDGRRRGRLQLVASRAPLRGMKARASVTVLRRANEIYPVWRNLESLPRFMGHLAEVESRPDGTSRWVAKGPMGKRLEWEAEIIADKPNELISWRSLSGSQVDSAGSVHFRELPLGRGTEIQVLLRYDPPGGKLTAALAKLFGASAEEEIHEDLRRFKSWLEAGEVPTTEGQPSGRVGGTR